jgi:hypothetical protein
LAAISGTGCTRKARVSVTVARPAAAPARAVLAGPESASGFDCVLVNVVASDIESLSPAAYPVVGSSEICSYPGTLSGAIAVPGAGQTATIELDVPIGTARTVQVIGVELGGSGLACGDLDETNVFPETGQPTVEAYLLGRSTTDVLEDVPVTVANTYSASNRVNCASESENPGNPSPTLADGTYLTSCQTLTYRYGAIPTSGAPGARRQVMISGGVMTITNTTYGSGTCTGSPITTITQVAAYTLGDAVSNGGIDGYEIDLTFSGTSALPNGSATLFNAAAPSGCGLSLTDGVGADVGNQCSAFFTGMTTYPGLGTIRYDIAGISGSSLYFGKFRFSDDGSSPATPLIVHTPGSSTSDADRTALFLTAIPYAQQL